MNEISIWDKISLDEAPAKTDSGGDGNTPAQAISAIANDPKWKWQRRGLDLIGTLAWTYAFLKLFVFDVDREIVSSVAPGVEWLVDLRFFIVVAVFAILVLALRTHSLVFALAYIAFFPFVVLFWKLPRRLLRMKSWVAAFAVVNVAADILAHLRYVVVGSALFLLSALAILGTDQNVLLGLGAGVLAALLVTTLARTIWHSLRPSRFITAQEKGIERIVESETVTSMTTISKDDEVTYSEIEKFDATQQAQFLMKVSSSVTIYRALYFWGYQLDRYRRSSTAYLYSALSYLWIVTLTIVVLTLVNWALYKIDSSAFTYADAPSLLVVARYSFTSMIGGDIGALQAHSDVANAVSLAAMFIGIAVLAGLIFSAILTFRRQEQNNAIESTLLRIDRMGKELETRHEESYELSMRATMEKLDELRFFLRGVATFFADRVPRDWRPGGA